MAVKNKKKPRPNKNSDGTPKKPQPSMSHEISASPAPPPEAPPPPGAPVPGHTNPATHPNAPAMSSNMGTPAPAGPQIQERIQFKDLPPHMQNQSAEKNLGLDPNQPIKQAQGALDTSMQQGPTSGPVPNAMFGPFLPPDTESFPDDFAHLTQLMQQGYAPGASAQEHELGANADAMARAKIDAAMKRSQEGAGTPSVAPPPPPALGSSLQAPAGPPTQPGAPGGIPPAMIEALMRKHKRHLR